MHVFNMATIFIVFSLVGVEFSLSAFITPPLADSTSNRS